MNRSSVNVMSTALAAALALSTSACNRDASADAGAGATASASAAKPVAAAPAANDNGVKYAKVVSVDPVRKTVNNPKQVCHDQVVTHHAPPKDQHQIAGTAIGAVVGGVLGNQVGGGKGKTLATVAGAVGGGYAGKRVEQSRQHGNVSTSTERRCSTVDNSSSKIVAYDVRYEYHGVTRTTRMDHDPGDRVEVKEGVTAVSSKN